MKEIRYKRVRSRVDRRSGEPRKNCPNGKPALPGGRCGLRERRRGFEKRREWKRVSKWSSSPVYGYRY